MDTFISALPIIITTIIGIIGILPRKSKKRRLGPLGYLTISFLLIALFASLMNHFSDRDQLARQSETINQLKKNSEVVSEQITDGLSRTNQELSNVTEMVTVTHSQLRKLIEVAHLEGALQATGNKEIQDDDILANPGFIMKSSRGEEGLKDIVFNFSNMEKHFELTKLEIPEELTSFLKLQK